MTATAKPKPQKFDFDTVFDESGAVVWAAAPRPKRVFNADEVEMLAAQSYADGETSVMAKAATKQAEALKQLAAAAREGLTALAGVAHAHKEGVAALCLACAEAIAGAALKQFPEAPLKAALEALVLEIDQAPRLILYTSDASEALAKSVEAAARDIGFGGQVVIKAHPGRPDAAFELDWGEGRASFDSEAARARVAEALQSALAAEGLHGDRLGAERNT